MRSTLEYRQAWLRWLPAAFFAVAIFLFSSIPGEKVSHSFKNISTAVQTISPTASQAPVLSPQIEWLKVGHGIGYFCLGITVLYALKVCSRRSSLTALAICSVYAFTDELHQAMVPGRSAAGRDVWIDSLASLAGILILFGIEKWRDSRRSKQASWLRAN